MQDFIDELTYFGLSARIKRLSDTINGEARRIYAYLGYDIEPNWHLVFLSLKETSLSVTELAKQLQFSHPAIVKIIKKMKERGYVKSITDKKDSRKQLLSLTSKSKKLLPEFEQEWNNIQQIMNDCTTDDFISNIQFLEEKMKEKSISKRLMKIHSSNSNNFNISNCTLEDIPTISIFYKEATQLMKSKKQVHWPKFPRTIIENEIKEKRLWKIQINQSIACIWTTTFSDELIWEEKNNDPSVYIHKIAASPDFRGNNWVHIIVKWTKKYAHENNKHFIRLDTVGNNQSLIAYYKKQGFDFLGMKKLNTTEGLPAHYKKGDVCFFEIKL